MIANTTRRVPALLPVATLLLLGVALGSCQVAESRRVVPQAFAHLQQAACNSTLGSYALPKAALSLSLNVQTNGAAALVKANDQYVAVVRKPDPRLIFCLDHLSAVTASDEIRILKGDQSDSSPTKKQQFLGAVVMGTTDRTVEIAVRLIRAAFTLISGAPDFKPVARTRTDGKAPETSVLNKTLMFDPFDPRDSARINRTLTQHGHCVVMENYTFGDAADVDRYCANPDIAIARPPQISENYLAMQAEPIDPRHPGLLYRPRMDYTVSIYQKQDPRGSGGWTLWTSQRVQLENLSPIISLGVTRGAFAGRRAAFVFNEGALTLSCLAKTSELKGFVEIPYEVVRSVVALPTQIIQVRIGAAHDERRVLDAERQVLDLQRRMIALNSATIEDRTSQLAAIAAGKTNAAAPRPAYSPPELARPGAISDFAGTTAATFENLNAELCGKFDWPSEALGAWTSLQGGATP